MISPPFEPAVMAAATAIALPSRARLRVGPGASSVYGTTIARLAEVTRSVRLQAAIGIPVPGAHDTERTLSGTYSHSRNAR